MKILVVGATGFIGSALFRAAHDAGHQALGTARRKDAPAFYHYDLLAPLEGHLPPCDAAFLCAGVADYRRCEGNAEAWRTNVDGNIAAAKRLMKSGTFVVFLSSVAAEWAGHSAYGRAKIAVENVLQSVGDPAIVRFERVTAANLDGIVGRLLPIGAKKQSGIHHL